MSAARCPTCDRKVPVRKHSRKVVTPSVHYIDKVIVTLLCDCCGRCEQHAFECDPGTTEVTAPVARICGCEGGGLLGAANTHVRRIYAP